MRKCLQVAVLISMMIGFSSFFHPISVHACSCVEPRSVDIHFDRAETVFAGTVVNVNEERVSRGYFIKAISFEASEVWKGEPDSEIKVYTGSGGGDCGIGFKKGTEYLVYAQSSIMYGDKERLVTTICDRTKLLTAAQEDLAVLGEGDVPTKQEGIDTKIDPKNDATTDRIPVFIGIAIIIVILVAILVWRKGKRAK